MTAQYVAQMSGISFCVSHAPGKMQVTDVTHGVNPKMIGKNLLNLKDTDGKFIVKSFLEVANGIRQGLGRLQMGESRDEATLYSRCSGCERMRSLNIANGGFSILSHHCTAAVNTVNEPDELPVATQTRRSPCNSPPAPLQRYRPFQFCARLTAADP